MRYYDWLISFIASLKEAKWNRVRYEDSTPTFTTIELVDVPPANNLIKDGQFIIVKRRENPKWAMFKCPCGCGHVVTLALAADKIPHWVVKDWKGRPTLTPSIRVLIGCNSHFWVWRGQVFWCTEFG
jgi:hypothetical protein